MQMDFTYSSSEALKNLAVNRSRSSCTLLNINLNLCSTFPIPHLIVSAASSQSPSSIRQNLSFPFHFYHIKPSNKPHQMQQSRRNIFTRRNERHLAMSMDGKPKRRSKSIRKKTGAKQAIDNLPLYDWTIEMGFFQREYKKSCDDNENEAKKCFNSSNIASEHPERGNWIAECRKSAKHFSIKSKLMWRRWWNVSCKKKLKKRIWKKAKEIS